MPAPADAQTASKGDGKIGVTWLGHAAFEVVSPGGTRLLFDPFLKNNPKTPASHKDLGRYEPDAILITHSHSDHQGDALAIAKRSGAKVISSAELVSSMDLPDAQKQGANVGGTLRVGDVSVHLVPAMHGSAPGGRPLGFVLRFGDGRSLYHSGDTWIFGDMELIQEIHKPDILLLNTGGGPYTQSPDVAALAVKKYFRPKVIVPMHFGTFPLLAKEADVRKAFAGDKRLRVLEPGVATRF